MVGHYMDVGPTNGNPRRMTMKFPMPIDFKLQENNNTNLRGPVSSLAGRSLSNDWIYSGKHPNGAPVYEHVGFFHRGAGSGGGSNGVGGVPLMGLPPSYRWNNPMEYRFTVGIPMTPQTERGVPSMGQPWNYGWSNPVDYAGGFRPDLGYQFPLRTFGVHKAPTTMVGVHSFGKGPALVEQGAKQKPEAAASGSRLRKRDVTMLLEGFTVIEKIRKGGKSFGHKDKYYIHIETGKKLRSLKEVERFKTTGSAKKTRPIASIISNATNIEQPLWQSMQQSNQEVPRSSATGEAESAAAAGGGSATGGIPPETFSWL